MLIVLCLRGSLSLSFPGIAQCPGIHWMDVSTSFWLCSLLAVVSMSVTIGCLWCCICAMDWIADCECEHDDVIHARRIGVVAVIGDGL